MLTTTTDWSQHSPPFCYILITSQQSISVNGGKSRKFVVKYGVPQGSCLGPLLLVFYVSTLFTILEGHLPNVHAYADDTQLSLSFKPDSNDDQSAAIAAMQKCIIEIRQWMLMDRLKLNDDKTEFIITGTRQKCVEM